MFTLGGALWPHWVSALRRRTYVSLSEGTRTRLLSHCFHHRGAQQEEQAPLDIEASLGVLTLAAQSGLHMMRRIEFTLFKATHRRALAAWPSLDPYRGCDTAAHTTPSASVHASSLTTMPCCAP